MTRIARGRMASRAIALVTAGLLAGALGAVAMAAERPLEGHAADELAKYVAELTGREIVRDGSGSVLSTPAAKARFVVGRGAIVQSLVSKGLLRLGGDLGEEGFVIRSVEDKDGPYLVLLGGGPRGTLYAVYEYLERCCGVGLFCDGERVPRIAELPTARIDVVRRPRWPMRQYMMDCEYTSYWWDGDEWKKEVDRAAKRRWNVLSSNFDFTATWRAVWKQFGVEVPPTRLTGPPFHPWGGWHNWAMRPPYPEDFQDFQAELAKQIIDYGRSRGIKMAADFRGFIGQVPREFQRAYRDRARFLEAGWAGFEPPGVFLHPDDPLYEKLCGAYAREYLKRFGTDHLWASQSYCEMRPGRTPEETLAIELAVARKNLQAIRAVDPEAVLFTTSWTFLDRSGENALAFLKALPADGYQVWDMPSDVQGSGSLYRQLDYYCGKPWLLGYLFAYGGTTMLHGDPAEMIRRAQAVSKDPKAGRCRGICVQPEALRHNAIAFDLLSRLAWDPAEVELEAFVEDYAVRRYGKASAAKMVACFRELLASVYGEPGILCPLYMLRISNEHLGSGRAYGAAQAQRFVPRLQRAIELALEERDRAGAGPLYRRDLIDVTRQWLSDLFNLHVARLAKAFRGGDRGSLVREAESLREILDSQQRLLSSSEEFCLAPILAKARKLPHAPADMEERIRDVLTIWAGKILDYAHRDYYELVRFYYRKRVEAFLAHAQSRLGTRAAMIDPAQLTPLYAAIEQDWVKRPFVVLPQEKYQGTPVEAVAEILKKHRLGEAELAKLAAETF